MTEIVPSFVDITPFGPYCKLCSVSLAVQKGIFYHGRDNHPEVFFKNILVVREVQRKMTYLRDLHSGDFSPFLTNLNCGRDIWFCKICFVTFMRESNYKRHLEARKNICKSNEGAKMVCYPTICGRFGPKNYIPTVPTSTPNIISGSGTDLSSLTESSLNVSIMQTIAVDSSTKVPPALMTTHDEAAAILAPFVRPDEDVRDLSLIFYPLLNPGFEGKMKQYLAYSSAELIEDQILTNWIDAGRLWLRNYAAGHIANVSANVRCRLAEFEQKELDGVAVGSRTFSLRRGIPRLISELDALLRFFFRFPSSLFDAYKINSMKFANSKVLIEMAIIPKILYTAAQEETTDHGQLPVACHYCLSRGFTTRGGNQLQMNECGWFSSRISAVMHLLRAGVCGYLVTLSGNKTTQALSIQEMDIVSSIQHGRVTNLLASYVKRLRDLNGRKPPLKNNTVNTNGDITTGAFTFPKCIWSTMIPRVVEISRSCFFEIFEGRDWEYFLDATINMVDWVKIDAYITVQSREIRLNEIVVKKNLEPVLAKLQSVGELCLFGLGVGAVRHEEVTRLKVRSCQWHNSYLYFWSESWKQGSMKSSARPKLVEHRLSLTLSKVFILIRHAMTANDIVESDNLLPNSKEASMLHLLRDIFEFDHSPHMLNIRHLFTSIGNIISPEGILGQEGNIVSNAILTEKSGHTQGTGRRAYGTWIENSEEKLYDLYHESLGETSLDPPVITFTPFSESTLIASLKLLFGRKADFRSENQFEMVRIASNSIIRHSYVGLPCGQGKSLSWMIPMIASYLSGRHIGIRIVILPYKFLLGHMVEHAVSLIGLLKQKLSVEFWNSSHLSAEAIPDGLECSDAPSLIFLNLDNASTVKRGSSSSAGHCLQRPKSTYICT